MMSKIVLATFLFFLIIFFGKAQSLFVISKEKVVKMPTELSELGNSLFFAGYNNENPVFVSKITAKYYEYNELSGVVSPKKKISNGGMQLFMTVQQDDYFIHHTGRNKDISDNQSIFLQHGEVFFEIEQIPEYYYDYTSKCMFSSDALMAVCSFYSDHNASWYDNEGEGSIAVYSDIDYEYKLYKKSVLNCQNCNNGIIHNETLFYNKEKVIGGWVEGIYSNVYKSPVHNLNDTVLISNDIKLRAISSDGQYFLGEKDLYALPVFVILNVNTKHFQYILGRDYRLGFFFYSLKFKKFCLSKDGYFYYIDLPSDFPFDALYIDRKRLSNEEIKTFWSEIKSKSH